jgi:hypothetical protein
MTPLDSLHPDALLKDARTPHHRCAHQTTAVVGISATSPFILCLRIGTVKLPFCERTARQFLRTVIASASGRPCENLLEHVYIGARGDRLR